jgi:hypothetical protein
MDHDRSPATEIFLNDFFKGFVFTVGAFQGKIPG